MSEEQVVVTEQETRPRGMPGLTWAVILIAVGVVFLINNLKINGISIDWFELLRFWPVILILLGLDILLGRRSVLGSIAVAVIAVAVIAGLVWTVGITRETVGGAGTSISRDVAQELGDAKSAHLDFNLGAANTTIKADSGISNLVEGRYRTNENFTLDVSYEVTDGVGNLVISQETKDRSTNWFNDFVGDLDLKLSDEVPVAIVIDAGVGQVTLDLTGIDLTSLNIKGGVGNVEITLPDEGSYDVRGDMGIGQLTLFVPRSLEASVNFDGGISNADVPSRFESRGEDKWETSGYDDADDRATISVKAGIGNFEIVER